MKKIALLLLGLISLSFSSKMEMGWSRLYPVNNKRDVWNIESFGYVKNYNKKNAELKTSAIRVKWNIRKGRILIESQGIDSEDEYAIRLFDKDTLRIDYFIRELMSAQVLADSSYIIPKELVKDVKYVEILNLSQKGNSNSWVPKYEIVCEDGYEVKEDENYYLANTDLERYVIGTFESECVKIEKEVTPVEEEVTHEITENVVEEDIEEVNEEVKPHSILEEAIERERQNKNADGNKTTNRIELKSLGKNCWGDPNGDYFCD